MFVQIKIRIHIVFVLLTLAYSDNHGNVTETYRELCPFSKTCTQPPKQQFQPRIYRGPCCRECSCDSECWVTGSCCPDSEYATKYLTDTVTKPRVECRTSIYSFENTRQNSVVKGYQTITTCPESYSNESVVLLCTGSDPPKTFKDIVFVSDDDGNIYRNAYCALCNGVDRLRRWVVYVTCQSSDKLGGEINLDVLKDSGCIVWSENPDITDERTCFVSEYSTCNVTGKWTSYDVNVDKACEYGQYGAFHGLVFAFYTNVFCYICNEIKPLPDTCISMGGGAKTPSYLNFLAVFNSNALDRKSARLPRSRRCEDNEIYDKYADTCRELKCPVLSYSSNGKCKPTFRVTDQYPVNVCMRADASMHSIDSAHAHTGDVDTVKEALQDVLEERRGDCLVCPLRMRDDSSTGNTALFACTILATSRTCPLSKVSSLINVFDNSTWYTNTTVFNTQLLSKEVPIDITGIYDQGNIETCSTKSAIYFTEITCPHIRISGFDYLAALRKYNIPLLKQLYTYNLGELSETALSMTYFDICIDDYFTDNGDDVLSNYQYIGASLRLILCGILIGYL